MANILDGSIVRIFDAGGAIAGLGFLVTKNVIFTCSHILVKGKKRQLDDRQEFTDHILLDFPLIYPNQILEATVLLLDEETDVGVLRFLDESPTGTQPVPLVLADDLWGHTFRAFGFPENYDDGVWSDGILRGQNARGWIQIEEVRGTGYAIRPGFSGTPVWDDYLSGVVGMVVAADTTIQSYSAFIIPTNHLVSSCRKNHV